MLAIIYKFMYNYIKFYKYKSYIIIYSINYVYMINYYKLKSQYIRYIFTRLCKYNNIYLFQAVFNHFGYRFKK